MTERPENADLRAVRARSGATCVGDWVLHPDLGVLRRGDEEVRLNAKSLHVLLVLLEAGNTGVSRDSLLDRVWGENYPSDAVISRAITELRAAFGEKAGEQRYIRTLPKFGYQLVAKTGQSPERPARVSRVPDTHLRRYRHHYVMGAIALAAWLLLPKFLQMPVAPESPATVLSGSRPLTSAPGLEHQPRIVPGSDWVVHTVMRRERGDWDIFRVSLDDGSQQPVAVAPDVFEHGPAVSPLGDQVAYVRLSDDDCDIVIQSITLGVPEKIASCTNRFPTLVDWAPGGEALAFTTNEDTDADGLRRLYLVDVSGGNPRPLSRSVTETGTDFYPRFSPAGDRVVFLRGEPQPDHRTTLWIVDVDTGEERPLTSQPAQLGGAAWIDDRRILYSVFESGTTRAFLLDTQSGDATRVETDGLIHPDYRRADGTLVVVEPRSDQDLALIGNDRDATIVAESTSDDHSGRLSPDEQWIGFVSRRSGYDELWIASSDGSSSRRLTRFDGARIRYPDWHWDGSQILFTVQADANERLYVVDIIGGSATEIPTGQRDITTPRWTDDGWIAGCRDDDGWGICVGTNDTVSRIADGFFRPVPAGYGNAYVVDSDGTLYNLSFADGSTTKILEGMPGNGRYGWEVHEGTLYFLAGGETGNSGRLLRVDIGGGEPESIYSGAMPVADATISVGNRTGNVLLTLFQTSSDDVVVYEGVEFR